MNRTTTLLAGADDEVAYLIEELSIVQTTQPTQFALLVVLLYDIIVTIDNETKYFWSTPCTTVSFVLFSIRYSAVLSAALLIWQTALHVNTPICQFTSWAVNISDWLTLICMDYILYLRVRALYSLDSKGKRVAGCIRLLFFIEGAITLGILIDTTIDEKGVSRRYKPLWRNSLIQHNQKIFLLGFGTNVPAPINKSCALQSRTPSKHSGHPWHSSCKDYCQGSSRLSRLVGDIVYKDSLFITLFRRVLFCSITNMLETESSRNPSRLVYIFYVLGGANVLSLIGSRMLVHLKEAAENNTQEGGSLRIPTHASNCSLPHN